ncbi:MAG: Lrp/AsnC family transcriptional regulator [Oscillospiraceae bacterium]|nr:Lrp/AsnC family transcriptional regulator [Oscillospiraceae bacterium]
MDTGTELLKLLEKDCRATPDQLAAMLGESVETVRGEIAELEKNNVILGYNAMIDWDRTGEELVTAMIEVRVTPQRGDGFDRIADRIYQFDEVESLYLMSGSYDFAVTITGRTLKEVASFVSARLSTIEGVIGTATHFILKKYKEKGVAFETLPVQEERMKYC